MLFLRKKKISSKAEIPTSSMADIAFLLIIFFMTATIFAREKGLTMLLPEKGEEVKIAGKNIMQILVSPVGQVLVEEEDGTLREYRIADIKQHVEASLERNEDLSIAIKVARDAPYSVMVDVLDEVKLARAKRISLVPYSAEEGGGE